MVFPSVPLYLDPPTTWNQQQQLPLQQQQQPLGGGVGGGGGDNQELVQQQSHQQNQLPLRGDGGSAVGAGSTSTGIPRPNSMAERAMLAKIPQPEQALKCPRCDSTNTKFCYFNNYSLSQPRHFCKTCRRYWTRGGALRNVPVGGGCRRNKRSSNKSSTHKSSAAAAEKAGGLSSSSTATSSGTASLMAPPQHLPFGLQSLHGNPLIDYSGQGFPNIGLGFSSMQGMGSADGSNTGLEQWRLNQIQQFPFLGGMEAQLPPPTAIYSNFDGQSSGTPMTGSELITQLASVKMEDHNNRRLGMNLGRQYLGGGGLNLRTDQFWGGSSGGATGNNGVEGSSGGGVSGGGEGGSWMTNLTGFSSSSAGSLL